MGSSLITSNAFLIAFVTDYSARKKGFRLVVDKVVESCGGKVNTNGAHIASPGFPIAYKLGLNCTWEISAPHRGYWIEISFSKLHLLPSESKLMIIS